MSISILIFLSFYSQFIRIFCLCRTQNKAYRKARFSFPFVSILHERKLYISFCAYKRYLLAKMRL